MAFTEIKNLGFNWLTVSFLFLSALNIWQFFAYTRQGLAVYKQKSAASVSLVFAVVIPGLLAGILWYGAIEKSLVLMTAGICFLPAGIVAAGSLKYGSPSNREWFMFWIASAIPFVFLLPIPPNTVFTLLAIAVVIPIGYQLLTLYRVGHRGVSRGELFLTYLVKNFAYIVFGFAIENKAVGFSAIGWFLLTLWLNLKWYYSPKNPATA